MIAAWTGAARRARSQAAVAGGLAVLLGAGLLAGCKPASPSLSVTGSRRLAIDDAKVSVGLSCTGTASCSGKIRLKLEGVNGSLRTYSVAGGTSSAVSLPVSAAQLAKVPEGRIGSGEIRIEELAPAAIDPRGVAVIVERPAPVEAEVPTSKAYRERNWTPTAADTCPAELHRSYSVIGPDGKLYPTWHPPVVVDPATGQPCTFGHEHGDDPATSDIYEWVTDFLDADPGASRGVPFGYVSEALDTYAPGNGLATRHEDNVGHKIVVANDVKLVTASPRGYVRDAQGQVVTCDVLMKVHQGSHSGDALINNAHELLYAARCTDGSEVISSTLSRFGDPNQFIRSCDATPVVTVGSDLPAGDGGERRIPDRTCIDRNILVPEGQTSSVWALYEVWRSENQLTTASGATLASFDPWFGIRNPARAHAGGENSSILDLVDLTDLTDPADDGYACGYPFDDLRNLEESTGTQVTKGDPRSPFDGAQRDYYLHATTLTNDGGPTTWYTDPYGGHGVTVSAPGLVRQHVSATDNSSWPELERRSFDLDRDYGAGNGVHAPN